MEIKEKIQMMLETLPDKILRKERDILDKSREADKLEVEIKSTENSYTAQIASETEEIDGKTKKKFKNDLERNRELELRLANNSIYNENKKQMSELRKEIKDEEIMLSYLKRRHRSALGLARISGD